MISGQQGSQSHLSHLTSFSHPPFMSDDGTQAQPDTARSGKKRTSLTKTQLATVVGAELAQLLEATTADGRVDEAEVRDLAAWLESHQADGLPAIDRLLPTVRRVLEDGIVTHDERELLQKEIEAVLPPELRRSAQVARRQDRQAERDRQKAEATQAREEMRRAAEAEREAIGFVTRLDLMVAGVAYDGRANTIRQHLPLDDAPVYFLRIPDHPHDSNAIAIGLSDGCEIGYIPKEDASILAPLLDSGHRYVGRVKKVLDGGRLPIPVLIIDVYTRHNSRDLGRLAAATRYSEAFSSKDAVSYLVDDEESGSKSAVILFLSLMIVGFIVLLAMNR